MTQRFMNEVLQQRKASFPGSEMSLRPELSNRVHLFARVGS